MKTKLCGLFSLLCAAFLLTGCDDDKDLKFSDVPVEVSSSFESKYPSATRVEWEKRGSYYVAEFWQDGADTNVWFHSDGDWAMTETDLVARLEVLPAAVQTDFNAGQYASWRIEDIDKYERPGEVFYRVEIETMGQPERNLFYGEDGTLLKDEVDRENDDVTPDTKL